MRTSIAALALALSAVTVVHADDRTDCTQSEDHAVVAAACGRILADAEVK